MTPGSIRTTRYYNKLKALGLCTGCRKKADSGFLCYKCILKRREYVRRKQGFKPWKKGGPGRPPKYVKPATRHEKAKHPDNPKNGGAHRDATQDD